MSDLELLRILLVNIKNIREENTYKAHAYGILFTFLLSKEICKNNHDIQSFLEENKISFKPYVFQSRTQVVGRISRIIESATFEQLKEINASIHQIAFFEADDKHLKNNSNERSKSDDNYFDSLLNQFKRKKS